jgi:Short repeat of unknown function (DUF308)
VCEELAGLGPGGWKVWHYIMAVIFLLGGLWGFIRPVNTIFALAWVLGLILVFYGSSEILQGVASRPVNPRLVALGRRPLPVVFWQISGKRRRKGGVAEPFVLVELRGFEP